MKKITNSSSKRKVLIRLSCFIVLLVVSMVLGISAAGAKVGYGTGDWSNGPEWWSQGQSKYANMQELGCVVVTQARMLAKAGIAMLKMQSQITSA